MGGKLAHEIVSLEEGIDFSRQTEEPFLTVTIEIKNKNNLEQALDLFVKGDILDDDNKYFCEKFNQKIKAAKRCYFKELPPVFVVTLKRFEFEYNQMIKSKVNDYFEFPLEISLERWTQNNKNQNCEPYQLFGVLVHQGTAESGHYFSIIRVNEKWYEFNDQRVT